MFMKETQIFVKQLVTTCSLTTQKYKLLIAKAWCNWVSQKDFFIIFRFISMPLQEYSEASCFDISILRKAEKVYCKLWLFTFLVNA